MSYDRLKVLNHIIYENGNDRSIYFARGFRDSCNGRIANLDSVPFPRLWYAVYGISEFVLCCSDCICPSETHWEHADEKETLRRITTDSDPVRFGSESKQNIRKLFGRFPRPRQITVGESRFPLSVRFRVRRTTAVGSKTARSPDQFPRHLNVQRVFAFESVFCSHSRAGNRGRTTVPESGREVTQVRATVLNFRPSAKRRTQRFSQRSRLVCERLFA